MKYRFPLLVCLMISLVFALPACKKSGEDSDSSISPKHKEFLSGIETYVDKSLKENGTLPVETIYGEPKTFKGNLKLTKLHRKKVITYNKDKGVYFVCSNFEERGENGKVLNKYDFDFFMKETDDGWKKQRILLHKINGEKQLTYVNNKPKPTEHAEKPEKQSEESAENPKGSSQASGNQDEQKTKEEDKKHEHPDEESEHPHKDGEEHPDKDGSEHPDKKGDEHPDDSEHPN